MAGRRGDLIITGGENVWPETVEAIVRTHPDVADVLVRGVDDAEWGQIVEALVVPVPGSVPTIADDPQPRQVNPSGVHGTEAADPRRADPPHGARQTDPLNAAGRRGQPAAAEATPAPPSMT